MRKLPAILVFLMLVFEITGCAAPEQNPDAVCFYYLREPFTYGEADGAIAAEVRNAAEYRNNPRYLLSLYFQGPLDSSLRLPFPPDVVLTNVQQEGTQMIVTLNAQAVTLSTLEQSIAFACLARSCISIADVDTVTIEVRVPDESLCFTKTITTDQLLLDSDT